MNYPNIQEHGHIQVGDTFLFDGVKFVRCGFTAETYKIEPPPSKPDHFFKHVWLSIRVWFAERKEWRQYNRAIITKYYMNKIYGR